MQIQPYLFFDGRCEEALAFYRERIGAEVEAMMRFSENPEASCGEMNLPPGAEDKVMHAEFRVGETTMMASDGMCAGKPDFQGFALSLPARDPADAERLFGALAEDGKVQMPLGKTFFSPAFGMVADRFGITWMVIVPA